MANQDTTGKKFLRETGARILIDRKLRDAGWGIEDKNEEIYFWDYKSRPEQKVATFYSQRDLEKIQAEGTF